VAVSKGVKKGDTVFRQVAVSLLSWLLLSGLFSSVAVAAEKQNTITPFVSDGCSLFPDGWVHEKDLWCDCCFKHDLAYWRGGTREQRQIADQALSECVKKRTKSDLLAEMMHTGVRFGGHPIFPNWYRWGYGWPYGRGYQQLTSSEQRDVIRKEQDYLAGDRGYVCSAK